MNTNREERLQMRQRGAATRKTKEVDFGFSFGLAPAIPEAPPQQFTTAPAPAPAPEPELAPAPQPQTQPQPEVSSPKTSLPGSQSSQRTPGSARNARPQRPSTFDIPPDDDEIDLPRSAKRRKIETPTKIGRLGAGRSRLPRLQPAESRQNGDTTVASVDKSNGVPDGVTNGQDKEPPNEVPVSAPTDVPKIPEVNGAKAQIEAQSQEAPEVQEVQGPQELQEPQPQPQEQPVQTAPEVLQAQPVETPVAAPPEPQEESQVPQEAPQEPQRTSIQSEKAERRKRDSEEQPDSVAEAAIETEPAQSPKPDTQEAPQRTISPGQGAKDKQKRESEEQPSKDATRPSTEKAEPKPTPPEPEADAQRTSPHQANTKRRRRVSQEKPDDTTAAATEIQAPEPVAQDAAPKKRRGRPPASQPPTEVTEKTQHTHPTNPKFEPDTQDAASKPKRGRPPAPAREAQEQRQDAEPSTEKAQPTELPDAETQDTAPKKRRGRPAAQPSGKWPERDSPPEDTTAAAEIQAPEAVAEDAAPKKRRGRPPASQPPAEEVTEPSQPEEPEPDTQDAAPKKRGRPSAVPPPDKGKEPEKVSDVPAPRGRKSNKRESEAEAMEEPSEEIEEPQPADAETCPTPKPGKRGRPAKRTVQAEPQEPDQAEHEQAEGDQAEPDRPDEQTTEQAEPTRKKRAPRGETVPVTVHRLANTTTLGRAPIFDSESESDSESADELTQRTKHPTRGGVNQADVLNQICRETLDKTLTTLQTGIANETNPQRKAEWTRKKKAVEAFGAELEGRLFEMSEMLDSNFVLGVQLRRAKREMMDMRSRLYHVRREREVLAVRTDSFRRRYAAEENGRMTRTNINNSLHGLELAVERQRPDEQEDAPTSGLEYLVRAVGEEVSSRGDGGILNRIQAFNAELERAAAWLES